MKARNINVTKGFYPNPPLKQDRISASGGLSLIANALFE